MAEIPNTRDSLLVRVQSASDQDAWDEFVAIYRPVIYRLARRRGMQDADAQDVVQRVLFSVSKAIGRWEKHDPAIRFRNWLQRVARNAIVNALSRQPFDRCAGGSTVVEVLESQSEWSWEEKEELESEYRREIYTIAARRVQREVDADTWQMFEWSVVLAIPIVDVANRMHKSIGTVYAARSRVMQRLRQAVADIEGERT